MKRLTAANVVHVMDKENIPAITIMPGECIAVETAKPGIPDEVFTLDYTVEPYPRRILTITGPIRVEGCRPGDILKVDIKEIQLHSAGKMWMGQWMGLLMDEVDHCYLRKVSVEEDAVLFREDIRIPLRPMVGTIGVAPAGEAVDCLIPGEHGGNMDAPCVTAGCTLYLKAQTEGGLLSLGDVHAAMGHGEMLGTGVEIGSTVVLEIGLVKDMPLRHPMVENSEGWEIIVSGPDLPKLCREACRSAVALVMERGGLSFDEAYALVGQTADLKIAQLVNPVGTVSVFIPKYIFSEIETGG